MQKEACVLALGKAHMDAKHVRYLYGGDLLRQGIRHFHGSGRITDSHVRIVRSLFHIRRSTCSFCYERGSWVWGIYAGSDFQPLWKRGKGISVSVGVCIPASVICSWTVTGSGAFLVGRQKSHVRITGVTVGKIVDYGLKDSQNMGACMAPAAADTILTNLKDFGRSPTSYDRIITGDLGYIGQSILLDFMSKNGHQMRDRHLDCGMKIFDQEKQDTHAGGSGCGCAAVTLSAYILPKIQKGEWKRVLFVPTGALMSTVSYNEGASVPGIAHGSCWNIAEKRRRLRWNMYMHSEWEV